MLLPYASDSPLTRRPKMTWSLLGLQTVLALLVLASDRSSGRWKSGALLDAVGIVPVHFHFYTLFTYLFFHAGIGHLLINLFYLWVFGAGVEEAVGSGRFLLLYVAGGAVGGLLQCLVTLTLLPQNAANAPIVGASAACAGLIGLYAVRYYRAHLAFVGLPVRPHVVTVISLYLTYEIGMGLYAIANRDASDGVAHWAHIGGFTFGLVCAQLLHLADAGERAYLGSDAARAIKRSDPGVAIRKWETLLAREPANTDARVELARAWLLLGDQEQAADHYTQALAARIARNQRPAAGALFVEMRKQGIGQLETAESRRTQSLRALALTTSQLFSLGVALEDAEQYGPAADVLRAVTVRAPDAPEAETALLKVAGLLLHRLGRREEAGILARLFLTRYPSSSFRGLAEDLKRTSEQNDDPKGS